MIIAFFLSPFVVHHLGVSAYGVWLLANSLTGFFGLLDLGVGGSVTYYVARFHTQGEHEKASRLVSTALTMFAVLGTLALGTSVVVASAAPRLFNVPEAYRHDFQLLVILAGVSLASSLLTNVYSAIIVGLQRLELVNAIEIFTGIVRGTAILLALGHGKGLITLAIIHLTCYAAQGLVLAVATSLLYRQLRVRYIWSGRENIRLIVSFGSSLFLLNVSSYLILYSDAVVIGAVLPVAMVSFFAIAGNLITYSRSLVRGIATTISPLATYLDAAKNYNQIVRIALDGPRFTTMAVLPIVITFALRGKTFIALWMGLDFAGPTAEVLQILSLALFFGAANQVATSTMLGIKKHRPLVLVALLEGISNLVLSLVLVRRMGIAGVAWGTAIPSAAISLTFWPMYVIKIFGINPLKYILSTWLRPAVLSLPFLLISLVIEKTWHPAAVRLFFFQVLLTALAATAVHWFGWLSRVERRSRIKHVVSRLLRVEEPV